MGGRVTVSHRVTMLPQGGTYQMICTCGDRSGLVTRQQAEDWELAHAVHVQQLRAKLRGRTPSLQSVYAWFMRQASNPINTTKDRALWKQLATELEHRLQHSDDDQLHLW